MSKSSAILVLVVLVLVCSRIVLYFSKQNTRVLNEAFQFQCTVSTKRLQSDQSLAVNNSNTQMYKVTQSILNVFRIALYPPFVGNVECQLLQ